MVLMLQKNGGASRHSVNLLLCTSVTQGIRRVVPGYQPETAKRSTQCTSPGRWTTADCSTYFVCRTYLVASTKIPGTKYEA